MNKKSKDTRLKGLVYYYVIVQALHLGALFLAALQYWSRHQIVFPAPAPEGGWSDQAMIFLLALGTADGLIILSAFVFLYGFIREKPWYPALGLFSIWAAIVTAVVFGFATIPSGAWGVHPLAYWIITLFFLPFPVLFYRLYCRTETKMK